jgi:septal ring factor EnvC (AmiA/AmiB activator)
MMRARWWIALVLGASSAHAVAPQTQLNATLENLAASKETEAALKEKLTQTQGELETLQQRSTELAERLQATESRVSTAEDSFAAVNSKLAAKQKDFDARKAEYAATVANLLRMRELPPTALFTNPANIHQLMRAASVLEKTNSVVAEKAKRLRQEMGQLKNLKTDAAKREAETHKEKTELAAAQDVLKRELAARKKLHAKLNDDHARAEAKVAELSRESQSLQELIGKLAEESRSRASSRAQSGKTNRARVATTSSKGSLKSPVAGTVVHRFGERKNDNETYRGMVFKARSGATVVAPTDGEIVFTGPFRDYGNMVLIKHGNGYISLIAGLGEVSAGLNQNTLRGEPIGSVPTSGAAEVYVELRDEDAKPIDPANWFAKVTNKLAQ